MFKYLITINPLGLMYGSAGAFLSPDNLVGLSGYKFPPEAATLSGLMFSVNKITKNFPQNELSANLFVAGPFWAEIREKQYFYVPIPWQKIIAKKAVDEWQLKDGQWELENKSEKLEPDYRWQKIDSWGIPAKVIRNNKYTSVSDNPWKTISFLHPKIKNSERCVEKADGLFLENSVQMSDNTCLVYLSTHPLENGWYRFGGENHIVEIECEEITNKKFLNLLNQPIKRTFALITPAVWGSNRFSHRYPQHENFPQTIEMLTDKPISYRYRAKGNLGRGRYAVPAGSVYVLNEPLNKTWWEWDEAWFPKEGYSLKRVGCGLCLPIEIKGVA
ncbi:type III-B CRISPR module-associated Cmr3 family protein [Fortiea contorta]|uniref:type III-B CRISPR module-associated Cmr3 family protein n=1 Tax=Fortiea contorta TaxID=1892405 RepID=UPI00034A8253|nr:type III-B CRISPR module-associated Cmr3 family protein [Fortiea contorta]